MQVEKLGSNVQASLGQDIKTFSDPEKLGVIIALFGAVFFVSIVCGSIDGSLTRGAIWIFAIGSSVLLAFTGFVGWYIQFRKPYLAVGSKGVAFPLACREVIPWSNIASIDVFSELTFHQGRFEQHVAVKLKLRHGTLDDYGPTWRSSTYIFGYRAHYVRSIVLLSTIYCALSPEEVRSILLTRWLHIIKSLPWGRPNHFSGLNEVNARTIPESVSGVVSGLINMREK